MTVLPATVTACEHVVFQKLEDDAVLLNLETERYFELDDVGTRMWQLLTESDDTEHVLAQLLREYEVDESTLRDDLATLIEQLSKSGLITTDAA